MGSLTGAAQRLRAAATELLELQPELEARAPWPLSDVYGPGPESSWGPPEVLAHVAEMLPYWLGEIERVFDPHERAAAGGQPVPFGRIEADTFRVGLIGRDRAIPIRELMARTGASAERVAQRLETLTDEEAARRGLHPTRGQLAVTDMLEPFIVGHLEGHVRQLREILAAGAGGAADAAHGNDAP
ncbi:MAG TPA: DinB family protein [Candidatus Eisenbacteria bacterium]|nr:DinB family protein [Candidatus Eisenbacteria bacterium]